MASHTHARVHTHTRAHTHTAGAHHLDLMFSNPADPPSVREARAVEEHYIAKWISEARGRPQPSLMQGSAQQPAALAAQ